MVDIRQLVGSLRAKNAEQKYIALQCIIDYVQDRQDVHQEIKQFLRQMINLTDQAEKNIGLYTLIKITEVVNETTLNSLAYDFLQKVSLKNLTIKDEDTIWLSSLALGKLVSSPSATTFEQAEEEFRYAIEAIQLDNTKDWFLRYAACCEIYQIGSKLPILFAVYLNQFLEHMWNVLRDPKDFIRDIAIKTFSLALRIYSQRNDQFNKVISQCYFNLKGDNNTTISVTLLVVQRIFEIAPNLLGQMAGDIIGAVLQLREHKQMGIKRQILQLVPSIFEFVKSQSEFDFLHIQNFMDWVIRCWSVRGEIKTDSLVIFGQISSILGSGVEQYISFVNEIYESETKKKPLQPHFFLFMQGIIHSLGPGFIEYFDINRLIQIIFQNSNLSGELLDCLSCINIQLLRCPMERWDSIYNICDKLLLMIFKILNHRVEQSFSLTRNAIKNAGISQIRFVDKITQVLTQLTNFEQKIGFQQTCLECQEHQSKVQIILALLGLSYFNYYNTYTLSSLVNFCVLPYLEDNCGVVRQYAVITACALLKCQNPDKIGIVTRNELMNILERLINVSLTDPCDAVRFTLLKSLKKEFFPFLALEGNLSRLMITVNDKSVKVRKVCVQILGQLVPFNSSFIMPSLTQLLSQHLSELNMQNRLKPQLDAALLLRSMIKYTRQLLTQNLQSILDIFIQILKETQHPSLAYQILRGISACSAVCKQRLIPYYDNIFPVFIENLKDTSTLKRKGALRVIIDLTTHSCMAIEPYLKYESLLDVSFKQTLLDLIQNEEKAEIRKLAEKCIGKLGALDPNKYKVLSKRKHSFMKSYKELAVGKYLAELQQKSLEFTPSNDIYYPLVALKALMNILCTQGNQTHELVKQVLEATHIIFKQYNRQLKPLLEQVIPILVQACRESSLQGLYIQTLRQITQVMQNDIDDYIHIIAQVIDLSNSNDGIQDEMLKFLKELALHSCYEQLSNFPILLHNTIRILETSNQKELLMSALSFVECLKGKIDQYLYILIPSLLKLIQENPLHDVKRLAIQVVSGMCDLNSHPHISDFSTQIVDCCLQVIKMEQGEIVNAMFDLLADLVESLNQAFAVYIPMIQRIMINKRITHRRYEMMVQELIAGNDEQSNNQPKYSAFTSAERLSMLDSKLNNPIQPPKRHEVAVQQLLMVCNTRGRQTKEEWKDWMRRFSNELLKQAPAPALRACELIEQYRNSLELFNPSFVSCWSDLYDDDKNQMINYLEGAFDSPTIPTEVLQVLLNLAEFMEHDDHKLFDASTLGKLAYKCKAYAKALHYKEVEFHTSAPSQEIIESLISLNNLLHQHEAANGIRAFAKKKGWEDLSQSSQQEFHRWQDAEQLHEKINELLIINPANSHSDEHTLTRMKCLKALSDWRKLISLVEIKWSTFENDQQSRKEVAHYASAAAWNLGRWEELEKYAKEMDGNLFEHSFYRAILCINENNWEGSKKFLDNAWDLVDAKLSGMLRESYMRSYPAIVELQQLCDLEEYIDFKAQEETQDKRMDLLNLWNSRLKGCQQTIDIWEKAFSFRPLLVSPEEDVEFWIQFAELSMKNGQMRLAGDTLDTLLLRTRVDMNIVNRSLLYGGNDPRPSKAVFVHIKYLYKVESKHRALNLMRNFVKEQENQGASHQDLCNYYLQLAKWEQDANNEERVLPNIEIAQKYNQQSYKAWHKWGIMNYNQLTKIEKHHNLDEEAILILEHHINCSVQGFIQSIALEYNISSTYKLQSLLRLITLWFKYGNKPLVGEKILQSFDILPVDVWLSVVPQISARGSTTDPKLKELIATLLKRLAKYHPYALVYSLTMAARSSNKEQTTVASVALKEMRNHWPEIVQDTLLLTEELIRVSVLWKEGWLEAIVESSQMYFDEKNYDRMVQILKPMHEQLRKGPESMNEVAFYQAYAADLFEAEYWLNRYEKTKRIINLQQAWGIYYTIYQKIHKLNLKDINLENVSPKLFTAKNLKAAVPGLYNSNKPHILIQSVDKQLNVFTSKQRPRKVHMTGTNGKEYHFLLKGREDIRQDMLAMQLFGLVNDLLKADPQTNSKDLAITRYAVVPLSATCGLIGWVHGCDTISQLLLEYRQRKRIELYVERELIKGIYPRYDLLPLIKKIEIFEHAMAQTKGEDLQKILWSKSPNSEIWLERRTNYTCSLATMSMVGYILGLGDRHPSNLMLDRYSGKIIHIDFGDCFEVAMKRSRCPEKVPFRLTRMLVKAMEISGIEGNFRNTCEQVMQVLRQNKDSLMAMLEVFLYEPLVSWRIIAMEQVKQEGDELRHEKVNLDVEKLDMTEDLNKKALEVLDRVVQKLTGRDFGDSQELAIPEQVDRLIQEARSIKNLCQSFIGWCPFW